MADPQSRGFSDELLALSVRGAEVGNCETAYHVLMGALYDAEHRGMRQELRKLRSSLTNQGSPRCNRAAVNPPEVLCMVISVSRSKERNRLTLRVSEQGEPDYEVTIQPGESALGFTYEEWETAVGPQEQCRIEVAEDGTLRPAPDEFDAPADGHA